MDMSMNGGGSMGPLSPKGVDFSNTTQASDFLGAILDDDELKIIGNRYAVYFWYGVAVAVAIGMVFDFTRWLTLKLRYCILHGPYQSLLVVLANDLV